MASVQLRGEVWYACVRVTDAETGRRKQKQIKLDLRRVRTEKQARRAADRLQEEIDSGQWADAGNLTVGQFLQQWYEDCAEPTMAPQTLQAVRVAVRNWTEQIGGTRLDRLTSPAIQRACRMLSETLAPSTVHIRVVTLRQALSQAVRWGMLSRNPADGLKLPKADPTAPPVLGAEEALAFLAAARAHPLGLRAILALGLGLRRGEVQALQWGDIDWTAGQVRVERALQACDRTFRAPKNGKPRIVILPAFVRLALEEEQRRQEKVRVNRPDWNQLGLVCPTPAGTPTKGNTSGLMQELCEAAGIPRARYHALRHSFVTLAISDGADIKAVSELAGHSSVNITLRVYHHTTAQGRQDVADRLGRLLGGEKPAPC
jgi:integrase